MSDPLARIAALPEVGDAVTSARDRIDTLLGHRILRRRSAEVSGESALRGARASAALEGVSVPLEELRSRVGVDGGSYGSYGSAGSYGSPGSYGPPGLVVSGALRVSVEIGPLAGVWRRAPRQALARLHTLAAAGSVVDADDLGRPRSSGDVRVPSGDVRVPSAGMPDPGRDSDRNPDPLGLGPPPDAAEVAARLDALSDLLTAPTDAPAIVVAAVAHGELLALRPFGTADGIVARAAVRLTLLDRGVDPKSLVAPEVGHLELGAAYPEALRGYASGTAGGVATWVRHCAAALELGARDILAVCEALQRA